MKFLIVLIAMIFSIQALAVSSDFSVPGLKFYGDENKTSVGMSYATSAIWDKRDWFYAGQTQFRLYGKAKVKLSTVYHDTRRDDWDRLNKKIDTLLYIYSEDSPREPIGMITVEKLIFQKLK